MRNAQQELHCYAAQGQVLNGRVILITGATGGIGKALSIGLAAHGAQMILSARTRDLLVEQCECIEHSGSPEPQAVLLNQEGASIADYQVIADSITERFGRLDGLVINAAMLGELAPIQSYDPVQWARIIQVNLNSNFLLLRTMLPLLAASDDASIVFTSADVGRRGRAFWGAYAVSKSGLEGLMQVLADELSNTDIRVNSIDPGPTRTRLRAAAYPAEDIREVPDPTRLVSSYSYLLGPASKGITGQALNARP